MTKLPDDVVHAAVEGYFGYKMPPSEERNQTMRRALDAASLNIVAHVEQLEEDLAILRAENETLRRDVKVAVMGDSAELQDVKRENEKLRRAMHDIYEVYAGSEGDLKQAEGYYLLCLITEMSGIAAEHKK